MTKIDPEEYTSPYPECRVTAATDPIGFVRLDVGRDRAAIIAKRVQKLVDAHSGDGLVDLRFFMDRGQYRHMATNIARTLDEKSDGVQVKLSPSPDISIMVLLNETQIQQLDTASTEALKRSGDAFAWEVSVSENGADMLVKQIIAAVKGERSPEDVLDDYSPEGGVASD